jgi:hypothetical protein
MNMGKETIKTKGCKLLLDAFQFVGISSRNGIPNDRGVFKLRSNNNTDNNNNNINNNNNNTILNVLFCV